MNCSPAPRVYSFMNKQTSLICIALALGATYVVMFSDLFKRQEIRIKCGNVRFHPERAVAGARVFILDKPLKLTSIKVVSADEARTNRYPHALWHLVASKGAPVESFVYGEEIQGMKADLPQTQAEPLAPDVKYRLIVETDKRLRAEVEFDPGYPN